MTISGTCLSTGLMIILTLKRVLLEIGKWIALPEI